MSSAMNHPIIIHKGKKKSSLIRRLRKGRGKLPAKVAEIMQGVASEVADANKILVPIVVHYTLKGDRMAMPLPGGLMMN